MEEKVTKSGRTRRTTVSKAPASAAAKSPVGPATKPAATRKGASARKAAAAPAAAPPPAGGVERADLVRLAAYYRAERRGFAPGYELDDWLAAEAEVSARLTGGVEMPREVPPRKTRNV